MHPAASGPSHNWLGTVFPPESWRIGVSRSRGLLSQFRRRVRPSVLHCYLQCKDSVAIESSHKSQKREKHLHSELEQFMACIQLFVNRTVTFRFGLVVIFLTFLSKQVYRLHSKRDSAWIRIKKGARRKGGYVNEICISVICPYLEFLQRRKKERYVEVMSDSF
jgi:hypothetical protein